jgi:hypothetical protein
VRANFDESPGQTDDVVTILPLVENASHTTASALWPAFLQPTNPIQRTHTANTYFSFAQF